VTQQERIETHAGCPRCGGTQVIDMGRGNVRACDYYGGSVREVEDDDMIPPEVGHRRRKELSCKPSAVWQRQREKERSQRRRDAIKRLGECEG